MEHYATPQYTPGYLTEKIVDAFLAGAIPVSDSSAERALVFRSESYIAVNGSDLKTVTDGAERVVELLRNHDDYERIRREPAVSEESLRKFFSWHPAVWPSHGDSLRQTIVDEVLQHCTGSHATLTNE